MAKTTEVKRGLVIGLGQQGYQIATEFAARLMRRHGQVPIIGSLAFCQAEQKLTEISNSPKVITVKLNGNQAEDVKVKSWLPNLPNLSLEHRAGGRLALLDLYGDIERVVNDTLNQMLNQQAQENMPSGMKIASIDSANIDIYVIANLGDPLASGLLIDLVSLIRKIVDPRQANNASFHF